MLRYANKTEWAPQSFSLVVRGHLKPAAFAAPIRALVRAIDPNLPLARIDPLGEVVVHSMARISFTMFLVALAAAVALFLGSVGLYGVIAYVVRLRTREIGVRMALGAKRSDILRMVLREGAAITLIGTVIGLAVALALTRLLQTLLYGVSPTDPEIFTVVPIVLISVAFFSSCLPASRAAAVDPLEAIRYE
jgi:ABC-type antimicrobial peptide transport system permease subunit